MTAPKRTLRTLTLLVIAALFLGTAASVGALPLTQAGTRTLRKPAWGLALRYPAGWLVSDQADSVSILYSDDSGGVGVFVLARDSAYTDPQGDLTGCWLTRSARSGPQRMT